MKIWRENLNSKMDEEGILPCAGDTDVTASPVKFLAWDDNIMVQILWILNSEKECVPLKEISWMRVQNGAITWSKSDENKEMALFENFHAELDQCGRSCQRRGKKSADNEENEGKVPKVKRKVSKK